MATIQRQTTWASLQTLTASALNGEFNNVVNAWNNHDAGTSRWTVMDATTTKKGGFTSLQILQVVQSTSTTDFTTTSSTFQTTNCSASITPNSTSSNILVMATGILRNGVMTTTQAYASLFRGATNLGGGALNMFQEVAVSAGAGNGNWVFPCSMVFMDSPATTAATTYSVKILSSDNASIVGFGNNSKTAMTLVEYL